MFAIVIANIVYNNNNCIYCQKYKKKFLKVKFFILNKPFLTSLCHIRIQVFKLYRSRPINLKVIPKQRVNFPITYTITWAMFLLGFLKVLVIKTCICRFGKIKQFPPLSSLPRVSCKRLIHGICLAIAECSNIRVCRGVCQPFSEWSSVSGCHILF